MNNKSKQLRIRERGRGMMTSGWSIFMTWFISLEDSVVKGHRGRVTLKGNSVVM
jgi:hypothetical protein